MSETLLLADRAKENGWWHFVPDSLVAWDQHAYDLLVSSDPQSNLYWFADQMAHRWLGMVLLLGALGAMLALSYRRHRSRKTLAYELIFFLVLVGVGNMLSDEIKRLFARLKPHVSMDIAGAKQPLSFPSNHSVNTATILGFWAVALRSIEKRSWAMAIVILTLIWAFTGWTRVYLGEHFPLDVLGGFLFGILYGFYGAWLLTLVHPWLGKRAH